MSKNFSNKQQGFIALLSIIIISTILFVATLSISQFNIAGRFFLMDLEQKTASYKLAQACTEIVRINIYNDANYQINFPQNINIDKYLCTIQSVNKNGQETTLKVTGKNGQAITNLQIIFNNSTADYLSWIEVGHF